MSSKIDPKVEAAEVAPPEKTEAEHFAEWRAAERKKAELSLEANQRNLDEAMKSVILYRRRVARDQAIIDGLKDETP